MQRHDGPPGTHSTRRFVVDPKEPDPATLEEAALLLREGGLVAFPTETVYGLGADARSEAALRRVFAAKGRPADNPLIVHVCDRSGADAVAREVPPLAVRLMDAFWPGPLTLVLPRRPDIPDFTTAGLDTVGVRAPAHPVARALLRAARLPVAAPSANRSGSPSPTTAAHVLDDLDGRIDAVVDGGPCSVGLESTVVRVVDDDIEVLRIGVITEDMLSAHGPVRVDPGARDAGIATGPVASPGMKHRHYSPQAAVRLFEGHDRVDRLRSALEEARAAGRRVRGVTTEEAALPGEDVVQIASRARPDEYGRRLYATLRACDSDAVDLVLIEGIDPVGLGAAVMDRLRRAAAG